MHAVSTNQIAAILHLNSLTEFELNSLYGMSNNFVSNLKDTTFQG